MLLKPLPYRDDDRVLMIFEWSLGEPHFAVSPTNYLDWPEQNRGFTTLAAASITGGYFTATGGPEPQRVRGLPVTFDRDYRTVIGDFEGTRPAYRALADAIYNGRRHGRVAE